jgi:hypothetical protein
VKEEVLAQWGLLRQKQQNNKTTKQHALHLLGDDLSD